MRLFWGLKRQAWCIIQLKRVRALHTSHKAIIYRTGMEHTARLNCQHNLLPGPIQI